MHLYSDSQLPLAGHSSDCKQIRRSSLKTTLPLPTHQISQRRSLQILSSENSCCKTVLTTNVKSDDIKKIYLQTPENTPTMAHSIHSVDDFLEKQGIDSNAKSEVDMNQDSKLSSLANEDSKSKFLNGRTMIPEMFQDADPATITHMISDMLQRLINHNDRIPLSSTTLTRFHSRAPPAISIYDYLRRIIKYASIEPVCLLVLLVYADRVCERQPSFTVSSLTVHRFIITAITVACKSLCDSYLTNSMYARVGGISTKELNILELEFLFLTDFQLSVTSELIQQYYINLVRQHPEYERYLGVHGNNMGEDNSLSQQNQKKLILGPATPPFGPIKNSGFYN
ncbi:hypothetical protein HK096_000921 [Nowakowskiella sp. JEL0078]|nr:hypothetical protein HK096_000921 [Nowakowskiella sp. JEL0078]